MRHPSRAHVIANIDSLEPRRLLAAVPISNVISGADLHLRSAGADPQGHILLSGFLGRPVDFDPRPEVTFSPWPAGAASANFIAKMSAVGRPVWVHTFDDRLTRIGGVSAITGDSSGGVLIAGTLLGATDFAPGPSNRTLSPAPSAGGINTQDVYLVRYDANGRFSWGTVLNNSNDGGEAATSLKLDRFGSIYLSGTTGTIDEGTGSYTPVRTFIAKFSSAGALAWTNSFRYAVAGPVALAADDSPWLSMGGDTLQLVHLSARGKFLTRIGAAAAAPGEVTPGRVAPAALNIAANGNLIVAGSYTRNFDFAPGRRELLLTNATPNSTNIFCSSIAPAGELSFAFSLGREAQDNLAGAAIDTASGDIVLSGEISGRQDLDPSDAGQAMFSGGSDDPLDDISDHPSDLFVARYSAGGSYVSARVLPTAGRDLPLGFALITASRSMTTGYTWDADREIGTITLFQPPLTT